MWKLLKIPSNHLNLPLCNMKNREKLKILGQCSNFSCLSSTTSDTHKKTTFSNINNHRFNGGFNNNNLFKQKIVNFDGKIVRHMSDEVPRITADIIVAPPVPKFEGITKILVDSPPIEFFQNTLIWLHDTSGLPWWANIVLFSCAMRTFITLPSALYQQSIFAKVANLKYEMDEIVPELKKEANYRVARLGYTEEKSRQLYNKAVV